MFATQKKESPALLKQFGRWAGLAEAEHPREVRIEKIGRAAAGKTALDLAINTAVTGWSLPSGLQLEVADPLQVADLLRRMRTLMELIRTGGIPATQEEKPQRFDLYIGDRDVLAVQTREVIGQILTHTLPDSPDDMKERYAQYLRRLNEADMLWAVVPCPSAGLAGHPRERFLYDLRLTAGYLKEALRGRRGDSKCAAAIVVTKLDTRFGSAEEAKKALPDAVLQRELLPLVNLLVQSGKVSAAAILPVSSYGFDTAEQLDDRIAPASAGPLEETDTPWVVRPESEIEPFNVGALMIWSLLHSLLSREVEDDPERPNPLIEVVRRLQSDLAGTPGWIVPLKGCA